jgi:hypothetical protein
MSFIVLKKIARKDYCKSTLIWQWSRQAKREEKKGRNADAKTLTSHVKEEEKVGTRMQRL